VVLYLFFANNPNYFFNHPSLDNPKSPILTHSKIFKIYHSQKKNYEDRSLTLEAHIIEQKRHIIDNCDGLIVENIHPQLLGIGKLNYNLHRNELN